MVYSDYGPDRETGAVCDYRMYDRIWQRVSPDLNPYPHIRDGGEDEITPPEEGVQLPVPHQEEQSLAPISEQQEESAGAAPVMTQCCMGTAARGSMDTLKGFLEEELAESRCCMSLSRQVCSRNAAQLLRRMAMENGRRHVVCRQLATSSTATAALWRHLWSIPGLEVCRRPCATATTRTPATVTPISRQRRVRQIPAWQLSWRSSAANPIAGQIRSCACWARSSAST